MEFGLNDDTIKIDDCLNLRNLSALKMQGRVFRGDWEMKCSLKTGMNQEMLRRRSRQISTATFRTASSV